MTSARTLIVSNESTNADMSSGCNFQEGVELKLASLILIKFRC